MPNRHFGRSFLLAAAVLCFTSFGTVFGQSSDLTDNLSTVTDPALKRVLFNSIQIGLISTPTDFKAAVSESLNRQRDNPAFNLPEGGQTSKSITEIADKLAELDKNSTVQVKMVMGEGGKLFAPITGTIPESYKLTIDLGHKFNPKSGTNDSPALSKDIDAYLQSIGNDPCIQHALKATNSTMADLKANWFGGGNGFEHVLAGEIKGSEVSGYHFWYRYYLDELTGSAKFTSNMGGTDSRIYTGSFSWDADNNGPLPRATKKKGGFAVGNSPCAILALGHIAFQTSKNLGKVPSSLTFKANINGATYNWQMFTMNNSIRSLYPMSIGKQTSSDETIREYYQLESELFAEE